MAGVEQDDVFLEFGDRVLLAALEGQLAFQHFGRRQRDHRHTLFIESGDDLRIERLL